MGTGKVRSGLRIGFEMISAGSGFSPGSGGMISYYDGLLRGLCALDEVDTIVVFVSPWNRELAVPAHPKIEPVVCRGLPRGRAGRALYEQLVLPALTARARVDVLLCTVNVIPLLRRGPSVVVLQSIQYFIWPEQVAGIRSAYLRFLTPRSLARADRVISVTDTERHDALELFPGVSPERMITVYHGVSGWTSVAGQAETVPYRLPNGEPYVLCVSRLYSHKNHRRLIEAFGRMTADGQLSHHLVIAGGDADVTRSELEAVAEASGVHDRVHFLGMAPQEMIPGLFTGASAVAYVSLYETFGHPVLEAFAFGLPLLTSSVGATAEVAGGAARLADPENVDQIADGLRAVLADEGLRRRLREAGPARVAEFTWDRCARETLAVLRAATERTGS